MKKILVSLMAIATLVLVGCERENKVIVMNADGEPVALNGLKVPFPTTHGMRSLIGDVSKGEFVKGSVGEVMLGYSSYNSNGWHPYQKDVVRCENEGKTEIFGAVLCSISAEGEVAIPENERFDKDKLYAMVAIGEHAFKANPDKCTNLTIPASIQVLETSAMENNEKALLELTISDGEENLYCYCSQEKSGAFSYNGGLKHVYVGRNLVNQTEECGPFSEGKFTNLEITFGPMVKMIPAKCLAKSSIASVTMLCNEAPKVGDNAFEGLEKVPLYVKAGTLMSYNDEIWANHFEISELK